MNSARTQLLMHLGAGLAGVIAVTVLAVFRDISGTAAMVAIMAMTGTAGAHGVASGNSASAVARQIAEAAADRTPQGQ